MCRSLLAGLSLLIVMSSTLAIASTISFDQCTSCGNPDFALQIVLQHVNPGDVVALGFINTTFSYDPGTLGPITTIDASVDKNITISQSSPFSGSFGNNFRPLIEQDGNFYLAQILGPVLTATNATTVTSSYVSISDTGLVASDFVQFDFTTGTLGSAHPNFSGDVMLFGLATITSISSGSPLSNATIEIDFDNLNLVVNDPTFTDGTFNLTNYSEVIFPASEPSTALLLGSGLGLTGLAGYGKKKLFKS